MGFTSKILQLLESDEEVMSKKEVLDILASQIGNKDKSIEDLEKWVVSEKFKLTSVHVWLPDLGVTEGKTGQTKSIGIPIIVEDNINQVARSFKGIGGASPDFLVLDGQNRVVKERAKGKCSILKAYVGDKIFNKLRNVDDNFENDCSKMKENINIFLQSPSGKASRSLAILKYYVEKGLMSQEELDDIRKQWKKKFSTI